MKYLLTLILPLILAGCLTAPPEDQDAMTTASVSACVTNVSQAQSEYLKAKAEYNGKVTDPTAQVSVAGFQAFETIFADSPFDTCTLMKKADSDARIAYYKEQASIYTNLVSKGISILGSEFKILSSGNDSKEETKISIVGEGNNIGGTINNTPNETILTPVVEQ